MRDVALLPAILIEKRSGAPRLAVHRDAHLPCIFAVLCASIQIVDGQEEGRALVLAEIPSPEQDLCLRQCEAVLQIDDEPLREQVVDYICA